MSEQRDVTIQVQVEPEGEGLALPAYATSGAVGMDLRAAIDGELVIPPGGRELVTTGLRITVPYGYEAQVRPRSGLALRHGIALLNSPGRCATALRCSTRRGPSIRIIAGP